MHVTTSRCGGDYDMFSDLTRKADTCPGYCYSIGLSSYMHIHPLQHRFGTKVDIDTPLLCAVENKCDLSVLSKKTIG
jgi:hypothetical protein